MEDIKEKQAGECPMLPDREVVDAVKAAQASEDARRTGKDSSPTTAFISLAARRATATYVNRRFGGPGNLFIFRGKKKEEDIAIGWRVKKKRWVESQLDMLPGEPVPDIVKGELADALSGDFPGYPTLQQVTGLCAALREDLVRSPMARKQEVLAEFDRVRLDGPTYFQFGEFGVCRIARDGDGGRYKLTRGLENKPEYMLRWDMAEGLRIADDAEFESKKGKVFEMLGEYFEDAADPDGGTITGNYAVDDLFYHLAACRVPTDLIPLAVVIGEGGCGKTFLIRLLLEKALGGNMVNEIDSVAFLIDNEASTPQRLQEARAQLAKSPYNVAYEGATDRAKFAGPFVKKIADRGVQCLVGGMHKSDWSVDINALNILVSNAMPKIEDKDEGITDRIRLYKLRKKFRGTKAEKNEGELLAKWEPYMPTLRRLLYNFIEDLVNFWQCKLPAQSDYGMRDKDEVTEGAKWDLEVQLPKFFEAVPNEGWGEQFHSQLLLRLGRAPEEGGVKVKAEDKRSKEYNGVFLVAQILQSGGGAKPITQTSVKRLLTDKGFRADERKYYSGYAPTPALVEFLEDYTNGNRGRTLEILAALFKGGEDLVDRSVLLPPSCSDAGGGGGDASGGEGKAAAW